MTAQTAPSLHLLTVTAAAALGLSGCLDTGSFEETDPVNVESIESSILTSPVYVHRAYKPSAGEHFYTTSAAEGSSYGFHLEVLNYYVLEAWQPWSNWWKWVPFYRCYWVTTGMHFYTTHANCEISEARNEGQLGFIATTQVPGTVPLYRLYQPSSYDHLYTTSAHERDLAYWNAGYIGGGIQGYVYPQP